MKRNNRLLFGALLLLAICGFVISFFADEPASDTPPLASPARRDSTDDTTAPNSDDSAQQDPKTSSASDTNRAASTASRGVTDRVAVDANNQPVIIDESGNEYPLRVYKPLLTPTDPYASQWWVSSTGLNSAWDRGVGSYQTTVAVIDTGFALQHEEFSGRWYASVGEQGATAGEAASDLNCTDQGLPVSASCNNIDDDMDGVVDNETGASSRQNPSKRNCTDQGLPLDKACNNIDDDSNGFIDDVTGWDFSDYDNSVQAGQTNPSGLGTTHGTMVSGTLAATGNNGKGIAGVNWSTKILPLQALDDDEYGNTLTVARAVRYAADQNADVINISLGASESDPYLRQAISYAIEAGSIVVAAAGNEGCSCISYPANYPEVLAVGASNSSGVPSYFSNFGASLDLLAPGEDMTVPTWSSANQTGAYATSVAGTSFSSPYIAGLLALAKSHQPDASWGELTAALTEEANHAGLSAASPRSNTLGFGYVRADNLLRRVTTPLNSAQRYQFGPISVADTLGSDRAYQCEGGRLPTTAFYELTRGSDIRFTTSDLARQAASQDGWASKRLFYSCVGLPGDNATNVRIINLLRELYNRSDKS